MVICVVYLLRNDIIGWLRLFTWNLILKTGYQVQRHQKTKNKKHNEEHKNKTEDGMKYGGCNYAKQMYDNGTPYT